MELLFSFNLYVSSGIGIRLICEFLKSKLYIYFGPKKLEFCNLNSLQKYIHNFALVFGEIILGGGGFRDRVSL